MIESPHDKLVALQENRPFVSKATAIIDAVDHNKDRLAMKIRLISIGLALVAATISAQDCDDDTGFCSFLPSISPREILSKYPKLLDDSITGNDEIVCPYLRMLARNDVLIHKILFPQTENIKLLLSALKLGMPFSGLAVILLVSAAQTIGFSGLPGHVNLNRLWQVPFISHECGLSFAKGGQRFDASTTDRTIAKLQALADGNGRVSFDNLKTVKLEICAEQGVGITGTGQLELSLTWSYCAGPERGYVEVSDVRRFLYGYLPKTLGDPEPFLY